MSIGKIHTLDVLGKNTGTKIPVDATPSHWPPPGKLPVDQDLRNIYLFKKRAINPEYQSGLSYVSLRACLLHNKSDKPVWEIRQKPKYYTYLKKTTYSVNTGEITADGEYITDDLTAGNGRKIKAVNNFTGTFHNLYRNGDVSLLFYTMTSADQSAVTIQEFTNVLKKRITRNGLKFYGYLWVLEISPTGHIHYHLLLATSRMKVRGKRMPEYLKMDSVWGMMCEVEFVKKSVKYYLSKYFYKNKARITGKRLFSKTISKTFKQDFPNNSVPSVQTASSGTGQNEQKTEAQLRFCPPSVTSAQHRFSLGDKYDIWELYTILSTDNQVIKILRE